MSTAVHNFYSQSPGGWLLPYWPLKISPNELIPLQSEYSIAIFALTQIVDIGSHLLLLPHSQDVYIRQSPANGAGNKYNTPHHERAISCLKIALSNNQAKNTKM